MDDMNSDVWENKDLMQEDLNWNIHLPNYFTLVRWKHYNFGCDVTDNVNMPQSTHIVTSLVTTKISILTSHLIGN